MSNCYALSQIRRCRPFLAFAEQNLNLLGSKPRLPAWQALQLLARVPRACDLGQIVPQLVSLRQFDGVVELTLRVRPDTQCWL